MDLQREGNGDYILTNLTPKERTGLIAALFDWAGQIDSDTEGPLKDYIAVLSRNNTTATTMGRFSSMAIQTLPEVLKDYARQGKRAYDRLQTRMDEMRLPNALRVTDEQIVLRYALGATAAQLATEIQACLETEENPVPDFPPQLDC